MNKKIIAQLSKYLQPDMGGLHVLLGHHVENAAVAECGDYRLISMPSSRQRLVVASAVKFSRCGKFTLTRPSSSQLAK